MNQELTELECERTELPESSRDRVRLQADDRDWQLIGSVGGGDLAAFEELYKRYYDYIFRFAYQTMRRPDLSEEVVNEVMLVVWRKAAATERRSRASTWILGIAYKLCMKMLRRQGDINRSMSLTQNEIEITDEGAWAQDIETNNLMLAALNLLSPEQRMVLELVYYQGMHYHEIAEVMSCPENTVKTRVFHARRKLQSHWARLTGGSSPDTTYH